RRFETLGLCVCIEVLDILVGKAHANFHTCMLPRVRLRSYPAWQHLTVDPADLLDGHAVATAVYEKVWSFLADRPDVALRRLALRPGSPRVYLKSVDVGLPGLEPHAPVDVVGRLP